MTLTLRTTEPAGGRPAIRRRIRRMFAAVAGMAIALLTFAGPVSAAPAASATPRTAADVGYLVLCTGGTYGTGDCYTYPPQLSNTTCSATGKSFHSGANFSTQNQYMYSSGHCGTGIAFLLEHDGGWFQNLPVGSFRHT
jgi:hypothetical protein